MNAFSGGVPAGCGRGARALGCGPDGSRPARPGPRPGRRSAKRPGGDPTVGSPSTAPRCRARPARRGWSRPVALTTSTSGTTGRLRTACSSSGPSRRASRAGRYGPPAGPLLTAPGQQAAAVGHGGAGKARVAGGAGPLDPFEADEAGADPRQGRGWLPAFRGDVANEARVALGGPHPSPRLVPSPPGRSRVVLAGRATRVPHLTGNPGPERTTTVTAIRPPSTPSHACAARTHPANVPDKVRSPTVA
jgi:hypothetical protein